MSAPPMMSGCGSSNEVVRWGKLMSWDDIFRGRFRVSAETGCWEWLRLDGTLPRHGYGSVRYEGRARHTHIVSWLLCAGPVPSGMCVLHKCDNRACIRPDHLFLGSVAENNRDMAAKGRHWLGSPWAKLSDADVELIRGSQLSRRKLGRMLGVSDGVIYRIKHGANRPVSPAP